MTGRGYMREALIQMKRVWDENEGRNKKKRRMHKNVLNGRKWFMCCTRGTGETDHYEILVNDS